MFGVKFNYKVNCPHCGAVIDSKEQGTSGIYSSEEFRGTVAEDYCKECKKFVFIRNYSEPDKAECITVIDTNKLQTVFF